jgi:surface polysaccharide O-acyltransferase-like enzyme
MGLATPSADAAPSRYLRHVHLLRGIAIMLVVGAHCWPAFGWTEKQTAGMLLVFDNVTVVFMFISGLLFQHLSRDFRYLRYLRHRISIIVLPYIIISIPAVLMAVFFTHREAVWPWVYQMPAWKEILFFYLTGKHLAPLWFIPMMTLFIVCAPLFIWIDRKNLYPVLLPITLILAVMLGRDSVSGVWNVLGKALYMLPAYLAGMYFSRHRAVCEAWCERNRILLAAGLVLLSLAIIGQFIPGSDLAILQKLVLAALLLVTVKQVRLPGIVEDGLAKIAKLSFAIYFVHGYVITATRVFYEKLFGDPTANVIPSSIFPPSVPGLFLDIACVLLISIGLISIARRILGSHSRIIIGA